MIRTWVFWPTKFLARIVLSPFFAIHRKGLGNLPQTRGFILLAKHQRWTDIPLLSLAAGRPLYYIAKQELFRSPFTAWYLRNLGGVPLDRTRPIRSKDSFREIGGILNQGGGIVVFPEGTYYPEQMGPIREGMIRFLLKRGDAPLIPTGIQYIRGAVRTRVEIRFGEPIKRCVSNSEEDFIEKIGYTIASLSGISPRRKNGND